MNISHVYYKKFRHPKKECTSIFSSSPRPNPDVSRRHKDQNCITNAWRSMVSVCVGHQCVGYVCVSVYYINYLTLSFLDHGVPSDIREWSERFKPSSVISRPTENVCCTQEGPALQGQTRIKRWNLSYIMTESYTGIGETQSHWLHMLDTECVYMHN